MRTLIFLLSKRPKEARRIADYLNRELYQVKTFSSYPNMSASLSDQKILPAAIIAELDLNMVCDRRSIDRLSHAWDHLPLILITHGDLSTAKQDKIARLHAFSMIDRAELSQQKLRRQLAYVLQRAKLERKLRQSSENKSAFISNLSHEIRNPLNVIMGMSSLLSEGCNPRQKLLLDNIEVSSQRILSMVNDVLDLAKIEANALELHDSKIDLRQLLSECLDIHALAASEKRIVLTDEISANVPLTIKTDVHRLKQIIDNFLSNAIKYTETGMITLAVRKDKDERLRFEVRDTGQGIEAILLNKLFIPFKQLHACDRKRGTGLGLSICKRLAQLMGGDAGVESQVGLGTCFWFTIVPGRSQDSWDCQPAKLPEEDLRILIYSEQRPIAEAIAKQIKTLQIDPDIICDASEISPDPSLSSELNYDYIFADFHLEEVCQKLIKEPKQFIAIYSPQYLALPTANEDKLKPTLSNPYSTLKTLKHILHQAPSESTTGLKLREARTILDCFKDFKILVVDDEPLNRTVISNILNSFGLQTIEISSGEEALSVSERFSLTDHILVFLDCCMPGISGFETARQLRRLHENAFIVAITGLSLEHDLKKCYHSGMNHILIKPIHPKNIMTVLTAISKSLAAVFDAEAIPQHSDEEASKFSAKTTASKAIKRIEPQIQA